MEVVSAGLAIVIVAGVIESVIEALKPALDPLAAAVRLPEAVNPYLYIGALLGIPGALLIGLNVFEVLGVPPATDGAAVFGMILTGILVGCGGSNAVHQLLERVGAR